MTLIGVLFDVGGGLSEALILCRAGWYVNVASSAMV
jgi:hypothetical protein